MSSQAEKELEVEAPAGPQIDDKAKHGEEVVEKYEGDSDQDGEEPSDDDEDSRTDVPSKVWRNGYMAMKCSGSTRTRKAPPPAGDDSEEDEEDLDDEGDELQVGASTGRPRMTATKCTGRRPVRTIQTAMKYGGGGPVCTKQTAMKSTGGYVPGYSAYTRKAPPPSGEDLEEDEEDEDFEGDDGSDDEGDAESGIEDEEGLDEEQDEDGENAENGENQTETESSNSKDKPDEIHEGDAEEGVATKRKRLSD